MRNVSTYDRLTESELRSELVVVTSAVAAAYEDLGTRLSDYHRDYLMDYAQSASQSVSGKNREAQHNNMEAGSIIIQHRAKINSLILCRDLLVFMALSRTPGNLPYPTVATEDNEGLPTV